MPKKPKSVAERPRKPEPVPATYRKGGFVASDPRAFDAKPKPAAPKVLTQPREFVDAPKPMSRLRAIVIAVAISVAGLCVASAFVLLLPQ